MGKRGQSCTISIYKYHENRLNLSKKIFVLNRRADVKLAWEGIIRTRLHFGTRSNRKGLTKQMNCVINYHHLQLY